MSQYGFVNVYSFVPNSISGWNSLGNIVNVTPNATNTQIILATQNGLALQLSILGPAAFRVRFNPQAGASYDPPGNSYAVVNRNLGPVTPTLSQTLSVLTIDTGVIQIKVNLQPYALAVYRNGQLIHSDPAGQNLIYAAGGSAIAHMKIYPANANYLGLGERAGSSLLKNGFVTTLFNYDNFTYANPFEDNSGPLPPGQQPGPLNPGEPLYNSVPFILETNPNPVGPNSGAPYSYGIFFDNPSQSYVNFGANLPFIYPNYSMYGLYYFGALYGEMDYYFMYGNQIPAVLDQYTQLTGRPAMPPMYALGYHQGGYGYFDKAKLLNVANSYRAAQIPIDGLHIDVDFQDNYRTFTSSNIKFPSVQQMFASLKAIGFKCSTNITSLVTCNPLDEQGNSGTPYPTRDNGLAAGAFLFNTHANSGESPNLFLGQEQYGDNFGSNPYSYPPIPQNFPVPLGASGFYPNLGDPVVQKWWGQQYAYLLSVGLEMIWQDMTCPAIGLDVSQIVAVTSNGQINASQYLSLTPIQSGPGPADNPQRSFPLDLMLIGPDGDYQPSATIHNGYVNNLLMATREGIDLLRPAKRNFIIARGGYAGAQRYAALWTGDSASSWDFLATNVPEMINNGLSGQPLSGCDIGGFANGSGSVPNGNPIVQNGQVVGGVTNYELYTRWMNLGAFLPWYRNHYDGYSKAFQEPYMYGEPVPTNCRKYIEIRYQMLQVFYDAMYNASQTGMPLARALFLNFPNDPGVYNIDQSPNQSPSLGQRRFIDTEFMVGDLILVAPIVDQHDTSNPPTTPERYIYLPYAPGVQWYAYMNNTAPLGPPVDGGVTIGQTPGTDPYYAPLGVVPLYIKAGAILPMRELEQYVGELPVNPLTFNIYPGADSSYTLYQDDGISSNPVFRLTRISHAGIANGQSVTIQPLQGSYMPPANFYYVSLLGTNAPSSVQANSAALPQIMGATPEAAAAALAASAVNAYYYNPNIKTTFVKIFDKNTTENLVVLF